jgi:4a-hydroxytetrahydrobiopterin dehydratase
VTTLLDDTQIADTLESLPGWTGDSTGLRRELQLDPTKDAELRRQIGIDGEAMGHVPSFEKTNGGTLIVLRTDDAGGVTELDVVMASHISDLAHRLSADEPGVDAVRTDETVAVFRAADNSDEVELPRTNTAMLES